METRWGYPPPPSGTDGVTPPFPSSCRQTHKVKQESPPAWTQEAYCPPRSHSKCLLFWGGTWGTPPTWDGVPPGPEMGYPPDLRWGTPPDLRWGYPSRPGMGYTPPDLGWGNPPTPRPGTKSPPGPKTGYAPGPGTGYPPPPSIASTWYAAGGMPLAFTQEDFLVINWGVRPPYLDLRWGTPPPWVWTDKLKTVPSPILRMRAVNITFPDPSDAGGKNIISWGMVICTVQKRFEKCERLCSKNL